MRHTFFPGLAAALLLSAPLASWGQSATVQDSIPKQALDATAAPTTLADLSKDQPVTAKHAMVSSDQHLSTEVGVQILKQGGNAVDAAVAVGYAQAVVNPCCGNIGGGGFMLVHLASGKDIFLDFREKAPLKAGPEIFQDAQGNVVPGKSTGTYLGVGVPGTVMGLEEALKKYGTMTRQQVMAPAIKLAKEGFVLLPGDVKVLDQRVKDFAKYPNVAAIFLKDGKPFVAGDRLVQPQLARTLETISKVAPMRSTTATSRARSSKPATPMAACLRRRISMITPCNGTSRSAVATAAIPWSPTRRRAPAASRCARSCSCWNPIR